MLRQLNVSQATLRPNHLERACYAMLDGLEVRYDKQRLIGGRFCVDAFVPSVGLVIQFDGDYWHGHPGKYPEPSERQRKRIALDRSQDAYMAACGYSVLRLWESDVKRDPGGVRNLVGSALGHAAP